MNILTIDIGGTFIKYACMLEDMTDGFVLIFGTFVFGCFPAFFRCSDDFFNRNYGTD